MGKNELLSKLMNGLIVSCQAEGDEPLNRPDILVAMARAAVSGGAVGIRAERPENIVAIKAGVRVPVIGLFKVQYPDSEVYITPTAADAMAVAEAGADILALDATHRRRPGDESLKSIVRALREKDSRVLLMADVSTLEEGIAAAELGFDLVGTTLSGYTADTEQTSKADEPDFGLIAALAHRLKHAVPVIAEGRIWTPEQAVEAFRRGAHAAVVGSAITRPALITRRMTDAVRDFHRFERSFAMGADIGGTRTALGVVSTDGRIVRKELLSTRWDRGSAFVVDHLIAALRKLMSESGQPIDAIGIAVGGRVNAEQGMVFDGVPLADDFIGFPIAGRVSEALGMTVRLENDANAAAVAESRLMPESPRRLVFITLGTGIGAGIVMDGRLLRGDGNAGEFGHICAEKDGRTCRCGRNGCLEMYVSRKWLEEEAFERMDCIDLRTSGTEVLMEWIRSGQPDVMEIYHRHMDYLACGVTTLQQLIDPDLIVFGGELSGLGEILIRDVRSRLFRSTPMKISALGNDAGWIGAALLASEDRFPLLRKRFL